MGNAGASQLLGMTEAPETLAEGINGVVAKVRISLTFNVKDQSLTRSSDRCGYAGRHVWQVYQFRWKADALVNRVSCFQSTALVRP